MHIYTHTHSLHEASTHTKKVSSVSAAVSLDGCCKPLWWPRLQIAPRYGAFKEGYPGLISSPGNSHLCVPRGGQGVRGVELSLTLVGIKREAGCGGEISSKTQSQLERGRGQSTSVISGYRQVGTGGEAAGAFFLKLVLCGTWICLGQRKKDVCLPSLLIGIVSDT